MTDQGLRDALEGLLRDRAVKSKGTVPCHQLRELLAAHPAEPVGVTRDHCTCEVGMGTYPGDHHEKGCRLNPIECDHSESLYGRCTACGMTWEQQAEQRSQPVGVSDEAVEAAARAMFADEHCDKRQMQDVRGNWDARLNDEDQALYRSMARAALEAAQPFMQTAPQVVASRPTQRQLDGWLSDHEKVYHGELGDRCACGWRPDSWESEDEFDEYFRDHRSAAVLALMGGADEQATCAVEHPRGFGRCVFVAGHHYEAGEDWTPHADSRGRSWNSQPPEDSE